MHSFLYYNRDAGDGFHSLRHEICIDYELARVCWSCGLAYKYVVYSPRTNTIGHQYEFLHGAKPYEYTYNNRLLKIPTNKLKPGGNNTATCFSISYLHFLKGYHRQFDTMILPQVKQKTTKSTVRKWWDSLWNADASESTAITVPAPPVMRSQCMEIFLKPTKDLLVEGNFIPNFSIQGAVEACLGLFECVYVQWIEHRGGDVKWAVEGVSEVRSIMLLWHV